MPKAKPTASQKMTKIFLNFHLDKMQKLESIFLKNYFGTIQIIKLKSYYHIKIIDGFTYTNTINIYNYLTHSTTGKFKINKIISLLIVNLDFNFYNSFSTSFSFPVIDKRNKTTFFIDHLYNINKKLIFRRQEQERPNNII
jgi:hypothetical protein